MDQKAGIDKMWKDPEVQLARSATSALRQRMPRQLRHHLQQQPPSGQVLKPSAKRQTAADQQEHGQESSQKHASATVSSKLANPAAAPSVPANIEQWIKQFRSECQNYTFYFDSINESVRTNLTRKLQLLGSGVEPFFSVECTHIITSRPFAPPHRNQENAPPNQKSVPKTDPFIEKVIQMGMKVWSVDVAKRKLHALVEGVGKGKNQKQALDKLLQEEKMFGINSSTRSDRPQFIPFRHYYMVAEDLSGSYRPVVIREYAKPPEGSSDPKHSTWPMFRNMVNHDSPFLLVEEPTEEKDKPHDKPKEDIKQQQQEQLQLPMEQQQEQPPTVETTKSETQENAAPVVTIEKPCIPNVPIPPNDDQVTIHHPTTAAVELPVKRRALTPIQAKINSETRSLRASGFQMSCATQGTSRFALTSGSAMTHGGDPRHIPPGNHVSRLDKRMVDNQKQSIQTGSTPSTTAAVGANELKRRDEKAHQHRKEQARRVEREQEKLYCENCNKRFLDIEEHTKEETHQAYANDKNNFKSLDALLDKTRRKYKTALPPFMMKITDATIDGKNVVFDTHAKKRRLSSLGSPGHGSPKSHMVRAIADAGPMVESGSIIDHSDSWEKYYPVFF